MYVWLNCVQCASLNPRAGFGDADLAGAVFSVHTVPMFHGVIFFLNVSNSQSLRLTSARGVVLTLYSVACGVTNAVFKPQSPPVVPNPVNTFEAVIADKCDYVMVPPAFIEVNFEVFP